MNPTKYYMDTEFVEDGHVIDLLSIGIVSEDGREFYAQNHLADFKKAGDFVWRNVFPNLWHFDMSGRRACFPQEKVTDSGLSRTTITQCGPECPWMTPREIAEAITKFCDPETFGKPELWGYYCDFDFVAFCQLFGKMIDLPKGFPMYCRDLKQLCDSIGNPRLPTNTAEHHALHDAKWNKEVYWFLMEYVCTASNNP